MGNETNPRSDLIAEFQRYKMRKIIGKSEIQYHEDINYLNYRFKLQQAKMHDLKLCVYLLEFLKYINFDYSKKYLFTTLVPKLSGLLDKVNQKYAELVIEYPLSIAVIDLFSSFLNDFVNQKEQASDLIRRKQEVNRNNEIAYLRRISYFDDDNGLMIISGANDSFGKITYANAKIGRILQQPEHLIMGNSISVYMPHPFEINHDQRMKNFLINCNSAEIKLPLGLFLQKENGFLVECYIQIRCTALDSYPFFLVLLKERNDPRAIALLDNKGIILNYSENFPVYLGQSTIMRDKKIDEFLNGIKFLKIDLNSPIAVNSQESDVFIIRSFKQIKNNNITLAYLIKDPEEIIN